MSLHVVIIILFLTVLYAMQNCSYLVAIQQRCVMLFYNGLVNKSLHTHAPVIFCHIMSLGKWFTCYVSDVRQYIWYILSPWLRSRCVTPVSWPCETAQLHRLSGGFSLSAWTRSCRLLQGGPGWHLHRVLQYLVCHLTRCVLFHWINSIKWQDVVKNRHFITAAVFHHFVSNSSKTKSFAA